jgi:Flp pilus assembly protein TadD
VLIRLVRILATACFGILISGLAACSTVETQSSATAAQDVPIATEAAPAVTPTVQGPEDIKYFPSDEPLRMGLEHFNRGHFGLAEQYFRDAVTKAPKDSAAWMGLAATYDRTGRFDLADRSYKVTKKLVGETAELLNNEGYSYMLRGDLQTARKKLSRAYELEPNNPAIRNNLKLLNSSGRYIRRDPNP